MFAFLSSGTELHRFGKGKMPKIALVVLMFIPLIYGALYLWAFWAPDHELDHLPVALVNGDTGASRDGEPVTAGQDLVDELVDGHELGWIVTNGTDAAAGVRDGDYYFSVTIPSDFSASAVSAGTDTPLSATVQVDYNDSNSFLATTMGKQAMVQLRDAVATEIGDQTVNALLVGVNEAGDGIRSAADGAGRLFDGLTTASAGTGSLLVGLDALAEGALTLDDGVARLTDGAGTLATGLDTLSDGARALASSSVTLSDGTVQVSEGMQAAATGAATLSEKSVQLADGADQIAAGTGTLAGGTASVSTGLHDLLLQMQAAAEGTPASAFLPAVEHLGAGAGAVNAGAQGALTQTQTYAGLSDQFSTGAGELSGKLIAGASGAAQVATGAGRLSAGAASLAEGAATAASGADSVLAGSELLGEGTGSLSDGTRQLADGGASLNTGAVELAAGSGTLAGSLTTGGQSAPDLTAEQIAEKTAVIASPVTLVQKWENASDSFGEGFAPFFLALATFVGGLITWLILRALPTRALASAASGLRSTMTGFLPAMAIGLAQVVIMVLVLVYGIGLQPEHWLGMSAFLYLTTLAFLALQQMFIILLGTAAGRVVSLVLLMLQLSSSGGTYPVETTPVFFQVLHPFMPASYVVTGLRELITGGIDSRLWVSVAVLAVMLVGSIAISAWSAGRQRIWTVGRLHPELTI
ncbi:YhgE/Pip domain-containing protein [Cryobacterium sp. TMT2-18-3]|uniref:YhgE/Pip family protein n=1 Tax=unclassified Cryobacterium TaxID=2649013 RepID=UPI00106BC57B|nr:MULTISPECIES: YhgE/Pip domain-containing protein [unclassified Cryobacterium]TFC25229.1 YhgE/Pip domain-containing protein [Cryobacterium sp. TMT2-18-2]TFC34819.1 YhgE/Pip domain-containing protein [Cryobacterium sp. TMT2-42-4]TFC62154.1 YhgE/Pip domain-containing protein [Cryobacterium sp. TMT2-18-3]